MRYVHTLYIYVIMFISTADLSTSPVGKESAVDDTRVCWAPPGCTWLHALPYQKVGGCHIPDCILCMRQQSPSPGHRSTADKGWYWPKHILCSGWLCVASRPAVFQRDMVHAGVLHMCKFAHVYVCVCQALTSSIWENFFTHLPEDVMVIIHVAWTACSAIWLLVFDTTC